ncbi:MAG: Xaa-Pro peptidase family protein [Cyclobacteriaceae bacterium]|nr:Xaa-Pro peptidase family protein [Cyclobacteriaceae bacterium]
MSESRHESIGRALVESDREAWLMWRTESVVMATGYLPCWGLSFCLYPVKNSPILYIPALEPRDQLPSKGFVVREYPWGVLNSADPWGMLFSMIEKDLENLGISTEKVACLRDNSQTSPNTFSGESPAIDTRFLEKIFSTFNPGNEKTDTALKKLFTIKKENEIENIRLANKVAGTGLQVFYEKARPGLSEAQLSGMVEAAIQEEMGKKGVFYSRAWAMVQSGINTIDSGRFSRTTGRIMEEGEPVLIELATCVNGFWSDLTRVTATSELSPEKREIFTVVWEAQQLALKEVKPGKTTGDIDRAARDYIEARGYGKYFTHATGHHTGFRYHDHGPGIVPGGKEVLEPGMVITIEPGIYCPAKKMGCRIEDNVLVTEKGHETLSDFPKGLTMNR